MRSSDRDMNIDTPTTRRPCFSSCVKPVSRMGSYSSLAYQSIRKWHPTATKGGRKACTLRQSKDNGSSTMALQSPLNLDVRLLSKEITELPVVSFQFT